VWWRRRRRRRRRRRKRRRKRRRTADLDRALVEAEVGGQQRRAGLAQRAFS
jgi:hypothetical protein